MKVRLHRILSLLCVLALALGCLGASALAEDPQNELRVITVKWQDDDNYDQIRPTALNAYLAGEKTTLNEDNGWTGQVSVPKGTGNDWTFDAVDGYTSVLAKDVISTATFSHAVAPLIPVSAFVEWPDDSDNAKKTRPDSVDLMLLADNEPCGKPQAAKASTGWKVTWNGLRKYRPGTQTEIEYKVKQMQEPAGYTSSASGLTVTNTLQTAGLTLKVTLAGAPEGTDLSGLNLIIDGPDSSMPRTLTYGQLSSGTYDFGEVLPGAYLVRNNNADSLVKGYTMDPANSKVADAVYVKPGESGQLEFKYTWKLPEAIEDLDENYDPLANVGNLTFQILGPDPRMPIPLTYAQFTNGKYELPNLMPGVYTVVERNAETLVKYYTLTSQSVAGITVRVTPDGETTATLHNEYVPAPTPEPDAEFVDIPVTKTWNDNDNRDGNRPESITARLYADGIEVDSHVLTAAEGWNYTFLEKPRYKEDNRTEIVYTVNEDAVPMYSVKINGYNIVNDYQPELTSVSVSKIWHDNNNEQNLRPTSIAMTLSDGQKTVTTVVLNEANGWSATVNNLPTVVNGQPAKYAWKEQEILNYTLEGVEQRGNTMTFTNAVWKRPDNPPQGKKPKTPGQTWYVFEEYDTPLGVEIIINHVGDCFD